MDTMTHHISFIPYFVDVWGLHTDSPLLHSLYFQHRITNSRSVKATEEAK